MKRAAALAALCLLASGASAQTGEEDKNREFLRERDREGREGREAPPLSAGQHEAPGQPRPCVPASRRARPGPPPALVESEDDVLS